MIGTKGFTLIEVIVSMAIFLLIIGVGVGIFLSIVQHQRGLLSDQGIFNQISYAQEHMSKAIRMAKADAPDAGDQNYSYCLVDADGNPYPGQNYLLTRPADGSYTGIKFLNASDVDPVSGKPVCTEFYLDTSTHILMERKSDYPYLQEEINPLTSTAINMSSIKFGFDGSGGCSQEGCPVGDNGDFAGLQPRITISMKVQQYTFQTTISQRNLNVK